MPVFAELGVEHLWLVDPALQTLEVHPLSDGKWLLLATLSDDAEVRQPPFDELGFSLGSLWV